MNTIDVRAEMHKLASSKAVHAAAGFGVLASQTLRELPAWLARWRSEAQKWRGEATMSSLQTRANKYMTTARAKAADEYDKLATRGEHALHGRGAAQHNGELNGKATQPKAAHPRASQPRASRS